MHVLSIALDTSESGFDDGSTRGVETEHAFWTFLSFLYDFRLITHPVQFFVRNGHKVLVHVQSPERHCIESSDSFYVNKSKADLRSLTGHDLGIQLVGDGFTSEAYSVPRNSSFLVLREGWFSPLLCGDSGVPIPLYAIPSTTADGRSHDEIRYWSNAYDRLYGLWMGSNVAEDFALNQMQDHNSELSTMGRNVCKRIEEVTGVPTFYFLLNYRDWSCELDEKQKCPLTGQNWLIKEKLRKNGIDFKCDESRLVSELSKNCSDY
jgi:predicted  nucleic acid-binding Zn ribbon protein